MPVFVGRPVSPGYGTGTAFVYLGSKQLFTVAASTASQGATVEHARFEHAATAAKRELRALSRRFKAEYGDSEGQVLGAQMLMLEDRMLLDGVAQRIDAGASADAAVAATIEAVEARFRDNADPYLRERAFDIRDIGARILHHLADRTHHPFARLPERAVIVAEQLLPSDTVFLDRSRVSGIVTARGSENSHAAILARSIGIPAVTQVKAILMACRNDDAVAVDGVTGRVFLGLDGDSGREYSRSARVYLASLEQVRSQAHEAPVTTDGVRIQLLANVGSVEEVELAVARGAEGIGLLRTEFLFLTQSEQMSEEAQCGIYQRIAAVIDRHPITVRTLDIAPDKLLPFGEDLPLTSAAMRERGIHYSLQHPELLQAQIRAVVRAAPQGDFRILLPMVTGVEEIKAVRSMVDSARAQLGIDRPIPIGAMIETPPAVFLAAEIAATADFLSIGSNDLLQYLFGGDRRDEASDESPFEPSLIRAIDHVLRAAEAAGKEVSLCGEVAGTPGFTALLLGLGFRVLSMSPQRLAEVRYNVRGIDTAKARELAQAALRVANAEELHQFFAAQLDPWRQLLERSSADA